MAANIKKVNSFQKMTQPQPRLNPNVVLPASSSQQQNQERTLRELSPTTLSEYQSQRLFSLKNSQAQPKLKQGHYSTAKSAQRVTHQNNLRYKQVELQGTHGRKKRSLNTSMGH